jgi:hypothetical protein
MFGRHLDMRYIISLARCPIIGTFPDSSHTVSPVSLISRDDVIDKLVCTAVNSVKDGLVDRVDHWPGINGLRACGRMVRLRPARASLYFGG